MELKLLKTAARACVVAGALCAPTCVFAADGEETAAEDKAPAEEQLPAARAPRTFYPLVKCLEARVGKAEVRKPGAEAWEAVEEGRFYPLGSAFRVSSEERETPNATFAFGPEAKVVLEGAGSFAVRAGAIGEPTRTIDLAEGTVAFSLPRALKPGLFTVVAPQFQCSDMCGDSRFTFTTDSGDGDEAVVRVVTGSLAVKGRHYALPRMGAANQVRIRSAADGLFTSLRGESGDFNAVLDQGTIAQKDFETGETKDVVKSLDFMLSPKCAVKIFRRRSSVAERMVVSIMTLDASGAIKNRCAYTEGRSNVNSGELVAPPKDEKAEAKENEEKAADVETVEDAKDEAKEDAKKDDDADDEN